MSKNLRMPVFLCHAHEDAEFLQRLRIFLEPFRMQDQICAWSDADIRPGSEWNPDIALSIANAKAAVLFVSQYFLASAFVRNTELPQLLHGKQKHGLPIIPLIVRPCPYDLVEFRYPDADKGPHALFLNALQSVNPENVPLTDLSEVKQDRVFDKLARELYAIRKGVPASKVASVPAPREEMLQARIAELRDLLALFDRAAFRPDDANNGGDPTAALNAIRETRIALQLKKALTFPDKVVAQRFTHVHQLLTQLEQAVQAEYPSLVDLSVTWRNEPTGTTKRINAIRDVLGDEAYRRAAFFIRANAANALVATEDIQQYLAELTASGG